MTQACHRLPSAFRLARRAKIVSVTVLRVLTYAERQLIRAESHHNEQSHCKDDKEQCRGENSSRVRYATSGVRCPPTCIGRTGTPGLHYVAKVVSLCQVVKRFVGYSTSSWGLAVHVVFATFSGGLFEFIGRCYPQQRYGQ